MFYSFGRVGAVTQMNVEDFYHNGKRSYLGNGGSLEHAQTIAGHADPRTTKRYDRPGDQVSLDEIEKIVI